MALRRLLAGTTGLTFVLLLVGVYVKEVGADLACGMRWPLCDGAVFGLFPATLPSFVEWFHRLLALVVGVLIVLSLVRAVRQSGWHTRVTRGIVGALALLPVQALLGALTVLKARLLGPSARVAYEPLISVTHYGTGILLFTLLVAATLWAYEDVGGAARSVARDRAAADD